MAGRQETGVYDVLTEDLDEKLIVQLKGRSSRYRTLALRCILGLCLVLSVTALAVSLTYHQRRLPAVMNSTTDNSSTVNLTDGFSLKMADQQKLVVSINWTTDKIQNDLDKLIARWLKDQQIINEGLNNKVYNSMQNQNKLKQEFNSLSDQFNITSKKVERLEMLVNEIMNSTSAGKFSTT